ncbi:His-Xaa-Ser system radical SAM maturase HxsB, partial [Candidatus Pacearchaeota archaeon]|nr:His-Xaa-Ser system radical SAM maturase HxsB [Candidatus Pacearchaeota archaeon]
MIIENYKLMPFTFMRFEGKVLIVSAGGEYIFLKENEFDDFVHKRLQTSNDRFHDLLSKNFIYLDNDNFPVNIVATQYRTKKDFLRNFTGLHMLVITLRCNQKCKYCQVSSEHAIAEKFDMDKDTARKCVNLAFQTPSPHIKLEFQGGEPLLNFDIIRFVVKYAKKVNRKLKKQLEFVICTNLTSISKKQLSFCKKHEICISTSLDGASSVHNTNRPSEDGTGTYNKVATGISTAQEYLGADKIAALMTTTRESLGQFDKIVDEYIAKGFTGIFFRSLNPYGMAEKHKSLLGYSSDEFMDSYRQGFEYILKINLDGHFFVEEYARLILMRILTPFSTGFVDLQSPTGAGIGGVIYDYDGKVYVADEGRMLARKGDKQFLMGTVDDDYKSLFVGETIRQTVTSSFVECLPQCWQCAFQLWCGGDPVRNYTTQGDFIGYRPTNEFCLKNKAIIKFLIDRIDSASEEEMDVFWSWLTNRSLEDVATLGRKEG